MTFVPKMQYACLQSYVPNAANEPPSPALIVSNGECTQSPFGFLSFLPMYTDRASMQACTLQLFADDNCAGRVLNMTMDEDAKSGVCSFESGKSVKLFCDQVIDNADNESENAGKVYYQQRGRYIFEADRTVAAHAYLSWLCAKTATASPTAVTIPAITTLTSPTPQVSLLNSTCAPGNTSMGVGNLTCSLPSANVTTTTKTTVMAATVLGIATTETGWSKADRVVEHSGAAMALVIVVFAGSLML